MASDMALGEPAFWRADSRARAEYARTADPQFTRTERLRLEIPANTPTAASVRVLDRLGAPRAVSPVVGDRVDESDGRRWITVDLPLASLAQGDYVIEVVADGATRLAAFRVVR